MDASIPDLLRLLAVPVFGWAAWRDVKTRRVPNRTWYPLAALGLVLLAVESAALFTGTGSVAGLRLLWPGTLADPQLYVVRVAVSLGFVVPLTTAFWYVGGFGGADAKAFYVVALLLPVYPLYVVQWTALPLEPTPVRVFSLTVLSNTVVVGVVYPIAVALRNLVRGRVALPMVVGKPVRWDEVPDEYGMLLETPDGFTRGGLDLDALRMYLRWRGATLADVRADPASLRDPDSLPAEPNPPGDGGLATDGGRDAERSEASERASGEERPTSREAERSEASERTSGEERPASRAPTSAGDADAAGAYDHEDPWGAAAFLDDVEGTAYGTTPETLRDGLEVLATEDEVWISPGIPFLVPMFFGLVVSFTYGDVLFTVLAALGAV